MTPFVYVQIVGMFHILEREILESEYEATGPDERAPHFLYFASIKLRTLHVYWSEMQLLLRYRSRNTR